MTTETFIEQCRCGRDLLERYDADESGIYSYYVCSDDACERSYRSGLVWTKLGTDRSR
jgi:hypothetical protein